MYIEKKRNIQAKKKATQKKGEEAKKKKQEKKHKSTPPKNLKPKTKSIKNKNTYRVGNDWIWKNIFPCHLQSCVGFKVDNLFIIMEIVLQEFFNFNIKEIYSCRIRVITVI